ncbi:MAG: 7,8-didemethyl-8-hydroxy-5-deazariboflavin synthase subunit CofG [Candidatus Lindowbacteria bacterium RIFCSPLOWO2_12_FULL_62_27]|nr:MAG: 7,8-didemethyl-8-hydroxy-5-deazariboflavin synthase subunit CofG [Candidatus Lindowbacteria bacterium RIFCSPLOWO2_02_FULL_62_12]OGH62559.1 MAG: 7,8-didemethyl-8-hydroxy-5-deazariboflavin synthase subunit CofG [Candidatus Lindowbacteria bacterium RIFCSPLOWO2_12_FULL_62_27]
MDEELTALLGAALNKKIGAWGNAVTYSRKVFIPLTNLCRDTCGYCVFAQPPDSPAARYMTPDEVLAVAEAGKRVGCKEALFSLGEKPELRHPEARAALARLGYRRTIDYLRDMCERVLKETGLLPHANPGTLTEDDLRLLQPVTASMGMMLETTSLRLLEKGQAHHACPDKHPDARLRTLANAGRIHAPFTTGLLVGIGETWEDRVNSLQAIHDIHRQYGHIQEVIIQNFRAKPGIRMAGRPEPDLEDMLRTLATARLMLDPEISLQAPPNLQPESYAQYISAGLNDWGGVSPLTPDHINPEKAWPKIAELKAATESMGAVLRERLTIYPRPLAAADRFLSPALREPVAALAAEDGLAKVECLS